MLCQVRFVAVFALVVEAAAWSHVDMDLRHEFGNVLVPRDTTNLQTFTGALGGAVAEPITNSGDTTRPFEVGGDTFTDFSSAANRSCDDQKNACAMIANDETQKSDLAVSDCDKQKDECTAAQNAAKVTSFGSSASSQAQVISSDDDFTYFCDP